MNTMAASSKTNDRPVIIISAIFLLVSMICLIINYSVNRSINWSLFPIGALIVIWAMLVPMILMDNNKSLGGFVGLAATLIPYLFLIQSQTSAKGWVVQLALPITVLFLVALGVSLIGFRYFKTNKFYAVALTVLLFGVIGNYGIGIILTRYLNSDNHIDAMARVLTMSISSIISVMFIIAGYIKGNKTSTQD